MSSFHPRPDPVPYAVVACCERTYNEALARFAGFCSLGFTLGEAECCFLGYLSNNLNEALAGHREWVRIHQNKKV